MDVECEETVPMFLFEYSDAAVGGIHCMHTCRHAGPSSSASQSFGRRPSSTRKICIDTTTTKLPSLVTVVGINLS